MDFVILSQLAMDSNRSFSPDPDPLSFITQKGVLDLRMLHWRKNTQHEVL